VKNGARLYTTPLAGDRPFVHVTMTPQPVPGGDAVRFHEFGTYGRDARHYELRGRRRAYLHLLTYRLRGYTVPQQALRLLRGQL